MFDGFSHDNNIVKIKFASLCWWPLFSPFSEATLYFLLALLFARNSPFYLCPLLFSFVFLSPYSAYFGVLCNFLARFSGLALRRLLVAFFGRSVSLYPAYFQLKPFLSTNLNCNSFLRLTKVKLCRYFCLTSCLEIAKYWELLFNYILTSLISRSKRG